MTEPIRVLVVDDHAIVREGLETLLVEEEDVAVVGQAATGVQALDLAARLRPDVILMDLVMPQMDGVETTRRLRDGHLPGQVLVLTSYIEDARVHDAIQAGAAGYLLKDVLKPELLRAIRATARGESVLHPVAQRHLLRRIAAPPADPFADLTEREREVLREIAAGRNNKEIARRLSLSGGTIKSYVSAILSKLGLPDRTQAALYAVKHGLAADD